MCIGSEDGLQHVSYIGVHWNDLNPVIRNAKKPNIFKSASKVLFQPLLFFIVLIFL